MKLTKYDLWLIAVVLTVILCAFAIEQCSAQSVPTEVSCHYTAFNVQGSSGADISVTNAATLVIAAYGYNCEAMIFNNSANDMRCGGSDVTATANGFVVKANATMVLGYEVLKDWYCIRTGSSNAVANVIERRTQ